MNLLSELFHQGFFLKKFPLDPSLEEWVRMEQWVEVDLYFKKLTMPAGALFLELRKFHEFTRIETMLSIRDSDNEWEEDGVWHDDGSRVFAFSLSLNLHADEIKGGGLELRKKNSENSVSVSTPGFGTAILFLTGVHGYEHRTRQVTKRKRVMLVGWCS